MKVSPRRFLPKSLAGRLVLSIMAATVAALAVLGLVLEERRAALVQDVIEHQALLQTATLVHIVRSLSPDDRERAVSAFATWSTCARFVETPPAATNSREDEQAFSQKLALMLDEPMLDPQPQVAIRKVHEADLGCEAAIRNGADSQQELHGNLLLVKAVVPLAGSQWLSVSTAVQFPPEETLLVAGLFLLASLAVSLVAFLSVFTQTLSLRMLADASERLGRGQNVEALSEAGPTEAVAATRAFNTMRQRLEDFIQDRLKLLAAIGHDLRTPLTTLRLKAEFVADPEQRESLIATIDEMTAITEATLAFSRTEADAEPTITTDLADLLKSVAAEERAGDGTVLLGFSDPLPYPCRPVALRRAVRNLVDNALRYGGSALISLERDGHGLRIAVDDEGPGIPEDQMAQAFAPFSRLEPSRNVETGGIGLGLSIARSIVKAHGGELRLKNRAGGGLQAEILLPAQ